MISELEAEAIGVNLALIRGNCDECKYQKQSAHCAEER